MKDINLTKTFLGTFLLLVAIAGIMRVAVFTKSDTEVDTTSKQQIILDDSKPLEKTTGDNRAIDITALPVAVPAEQRHVYAGISVPPDEMPENDLANNFISTSFMTRGYCFAESQMLDTKALGGFGKSENAARTIQTKIEGDGLFLLAQPSVVLPFANGTGMRLTLVNNTSDSLAFHASDSRLAIIQEAQDTDGVWKPIEYLPSSWCGNSRHRIVLHPKHFWAFAAPRYKGTIPSKMRFSLVLDDYKTVYSNVFDGSVNPEQFSVKEERRNANVMNSYSE